MAWGDSAQGMGLITGVYGLLGISLSSWDFISQGFLRDGGDSGAWFVSLQPPLGELEIGARKC